ncbi:uncharacterized protein MICPUCDRAFT_36623 [Micromonas pusilla CCMP1545]|uniref:DNA-directed RNA polymerase subunit n=1 Tax=Micromonas pusilla (strain CCMP1545) TaxID=564608 RepID=C1N756_MICPC|nr:uncharacterized protein MICPUCDRAFT_36623 [Micromonas pusilla CCMP1545]EEH52215.1 predicted protein [Micromonas pusilla CCMP1545]|eukprot:XP_003063842.1 predicted protein [Micromonas pusilla CCMP1545]
MAPPTAHVDLRQPGLITKEITSTSFSFYDAEEARRISVKRISNPVLFDALSNPVADGLYDPALGPIDQRGSCATCRLGAMHCPGHFGHIELAVPVYNPLTFSVVVRLLRSACLHCGKFKLAADRVAAYREKLRLIREGDLEGAANVDVHGVSKQTRAELNEIREMVGDLGTMDTTHVSRVIPVAHQGRRKDRVRWTSHAMMLSRDLVKEFLAATPGKCENCGVCSPKVSPEGANKIYRAALTKKQIEHNAALTPSVDLEEELRRGLSGPDRGDDDAEPREDGEDLAGQERQVFITPIEARSMLKKLWANEYDFVSMVWVANAPSYDAKTDPARFFMQTVLVTPCRFRPPSKMNDMMFEHPQNTHLNAIIQANLTLAELFRKPPTVPEPPEVRAQRAVRAWLTLQGGVNRLVDSSKAEGGEAGGMGIRQQLEKKQGLFRMNMMGKRVNYAARSVIMPDPYLKTSEIGVPPVFAKKLTFPENVTAHNVELMRQLVENGPDIHPGANAIEDERGRVIHLDRFTAEKRAAIAKTLLATPATTTGEATAAAAGMSLGGAAAKAKTPASKVFRHLRDGDVLLVNRQPTLHKPGIMAHTAKVLPGQRTIRMHYANCSTYNADFDGDEMNLHFPQDHLARAEAYEIVRADQQYTVPTDGKPLRGLIQDHICAGVLMTCRDTFLDKSDFTQLMYLALVDFAGAETGGGAVVGKSLKPPAPAIRKPRALWTGKQLFTAVIEHITHGRAPMTVSHATKVPANYWGGEDSGEGVLVVRRNYVCSGILDKNTFGAHGLVHAVAELHGKVLAGDFISVLTRLLTAFLQRHGMTCGMDDLILHEESERGREEELHKATAACRGAAAAFAEADVNVPEMALRKQIAARLSEREGAEAALDMRSSGALAKVTSATVKRCLPHGTKKPFPKNCLSLMTQSGAKGSMVNFSQIAACLGQQELEGRRVPRMISGKTLPCFPPHDTSERAGGYVSDRFFSGLRPQEYYFHCMAGREGLVDTAVKTSRSGYLQRCLVKNLETLRVHYDHTVRDCDGSIVQFHYGDDAVDVTKGGYLEKFQFLADNPELLRANLAAAEKDIAALRVIDEADEDEEKDASGKHPALPVMSSRPLSNALGTLPERFKDNLDAFIQRADPAAAAAAAKPPGLPALSGMTADEFKRLMNLRYLSALASPGEAVGCVAAQSVGEPSTQMTLNTFHFAGRGEANVTLGIPRLRELLMAASKKLATPVMTLPLRDGARNREDATALARRLRKVRLAELVRKLKVAERPCARSHGGSGELARVYTVTVELRGPVEADADEGNEHRILEEEEGENGEDSDEEDEEEGAKAEDRKDARGDDGEGFSKEEEVVEEEKASKAHDMKEEEEEEEGSDGSDDDDDSGSDDTDTDGEDLGDSDSETEKRPPAKKKKPSSSSAAPAAKNPKKATHGGGDLLETLEDIVDGVVVDPRARTCTLTVSLRLGAPPVLIMEACEAAAANTTVRHVPGIDKTFVIGKDASEDPNGLSPLMVQTDGVNFAAAWANDDLVDCANVKTNDVYAMMQTYGVEAARETLVAEVRGVFGVYGIAVDARHLSLIGDFMMAQGDYRPCSRAGMETSTSPLLKMSFETAAAFLVDATMRGQEDTLESPSARIVLGRTVDMGTGTFGLRYDMKRAAELREEMKKNVGVF